MFESWYVDRDFPEIKTSNSKIIFADQNWPAAQREALQKLCDVHNAQVSALTAECSRLIKLDTERLRNSEQEITRLHAALESIATKKCPTYIAHPQSVWWSEHVQSIAEKALRERNGQT